MSRTNKSAGHACWLLMALAGCSGSAQSTHPAEPPTQATTTTTTTTTTAAEPATPAPPATPTATATADAPLPPMPTDLHGPPHPWAQMSGQDRGHYMAQAVVPTMGALFHAFSAEHFEHVTCATCHGTNAREVAFRMPNGLPALPAPGGPEWQRMTTEHPRMFHFMAERVLPTQAQLLGLPPFNPQTHQGFGCFNCHPHAGS